jgi:predicted RNA-binding protein YlqC (UPF0109 family)
MSDAPADDSFDDDEIDDDDLDDANTIPAATATDVLEYIVRSVVADPDAVEIEVDESRRTVALNVHVAPDDMGRVIGRRGRIANSIRTVVRAAAARDNTSVEVEFVD